MGSAGSARGGRRTGGGRHRLTASPARAVGIRRETHRVVGEDALAQRARAVDVRAGASGVELPRPELLVDVEGGDVQAHRARAPSPPSLSALERVTCPATERPNRSASTEPENLESMESGARSSRRTRPRLLSRRRSRRPLPVKHAPAARHNRPRGRRASEVGGIPGALLPRAREGLTRVFLLGRRARRPTPSETSARARLVVPRATWTRSAA